MQTFVFKTPDTEMYQVLVRANEHSAAVVVGIDISGADFESATQAVLRIMEHDTGITAVHQIEHRLTHLDSHLQVALLLQKGPLVLLGTRGTGIIYLKRDGKIRELVADDFCAEGAHSPDDEFILTTGDFLEQVGGVEGFMYYFTQYSSDEVVEMMQTFEQQGSTFGFMVARFRTAQAEDTTQEPPPEAEVLEEIHTQVEAEDVVIVEESIRQAHASPRWSRGSVMTGLLKHLRWVRDRWSLRRSRDTPVGKSPRSFSLRKLLLILVPTLFLVFLAVRASPQVSQWMRGPDGDYQAYETRVAKRLHDAETESFLDIGRTTDIFRAIDADTASLPSPVKRRFAAQLSVLRVQIAARRRELTRILDVRTSEYFDLAVEKPDLAPIDMVVDGDYLSVLDGGQGIVFRLSLAQRSYEAIRSPQLQGATDITVSGGNRYILTASEGISLLRDKTLPLRQAGLPAGEAGPQIVIPKESDWGEISDVVAYNGNIYLLDSQSRDIYKYQGSDEKTFGDRFSYLKSDAAGDFPGGTTMAIDSSIYVASGGSIHRYTAGHRDDFKTVLPIETASIGSFFVSDEGEISVLEQKGSTIYLFEKTGVFRGQIQDPMLTDAKVIVQYQADLYVLLGTKVYKIEVK